MDWQQFSSKLKTIGWRSYVYPAISTALLLVLIILVIAAGRYLSDSINRIFSITDDSVESQLVRVNFTTLNLVAGKLGLKVKPEGSAPETGETPSEQEETLPEESLPNPNELLGPFLPGGTPAPTPTPAPSTPEIKANLKIRVLNSTSTSGLAGQLRTSLTQAGFAADVGNITPTEATTVIRVKAAAAASFPNSIAELKQVVSQTYAPIDQTLADDDPYDVVIVIGNQ